MNFVELEEQGASSNDKRSYLTGGDTTAITIRIPNNLKSAVAEKASLRGLSFSAYVRTCLIDALLDKE